MGPLPLFIVANLSHRSRQEGRVTKDVKDVLTGRHQQGLSLSDTDSIDVGFAP